MYNPWEKIRCHQVAVLSCLICSDNYHRYRPLPEEIIYFDISRVWIIHRDTVKANRKIAVSEKTTDVISYSCLSKHMTILKKIFLPILTSFNSALFDFISVLITDSILFLFNQPAPKNGHVRNVITVFIFKLSINILTIDLDGFYVT